MLKYKYNLIYGIPFTIIVIDTHIIIVFLKLQVKIYKIYYRRSYVDIDSVLFCFVLQPGLLFCIRQVDFIDFCYVLDLELYCGYSVVSYVAFG